MSAYDDLLSTARAWATGGGVNVYLKTNLGPEIPVYTPGQGGGLAQLLGIQAGVIIRNDRGGEITRIGSVPPTDPIKVAILIGALALVGYVAFRGLVR